MTLRCHLIRALYWALWPTRWLRSLNDGERFLVGILSFMWIVTSLTMRYALIAPTSLLTAIVAPPLGVAAFSATVIGFGWVVNRLWDGGCWVVHWVEAAHAECRRTEPRPQDSSPDTAP